jgi:hypothetical protein
MTIVALTQKGEDLLAIGLLIAIHREKARRKGEVRGVLKKAIITALRDAAGYRHVKNIWTAKRHLNLGFGAKSPELIRRLASYMIKL